MPEKQKNIFLPLLAALLGCALCFLCLPLPAAAASSLPASGTESSGSGSGAPEAEESTAEDGSKAEDLFNPDYTPAARAVYMVNAETGAVVYENNADEPVAMGSLVKMMTCILAAEQQDLDAPVANGAAEAWIYDELYAYQQEFGSVSLADIKRGETLTVRELLYAAILPSANEAALLLASHVSGGYMPNFLYMMNARAKSLGCTNTYFADANGLNPASVSSARDVYLILRAYLNDPVIAEIAATHAYTMEPHEMHNNAYPLTTTNMLIRPNSPYYKCVPRVSGSVVAGKTGSLEAWQSFASYAEKEGMGFYCVVLQSPHEADTFGAALDPPQQRPALYESALLYNWAFSSLEVRPALDTHQAVAEVRVRYSTQRDTVRLLPASNLRTILPKDAGNDLLSRTYNLPEYVAAPVQAGDKIGSITVWLGGRQIGTADLVAEMDVARNDTLFALRRLQEFISSTYFKVFLVLVLLTVGGFVGLVAWQNHRRVNRPKSSAKTAAGTASTGGASRGGTNTRGRQGPSAPPPAGKPAASGPGRKNAAPGAPASGGKRASGGGNRAAPRKPHASSGSGSGRPRRP